MKRIIEEVSELNHTDPIALNIAGFKPVLVASVPDVVPLSEESMRSEQLKQDGSTEDEDEEDEEEEEEEEEENDMKSAGSDEEEDNDDEKVKTNFTGQPRLAEVPADGHVEKKMRSSSVHAGDQSFPSTEENYALSPSPTRTDLVYYSNEELNGYVDPYEHDSDWEYTSETDRDLKLNRTKLDYGPMVTDGSRKNFRRKKKKKEIN
jgi:hypothetical protein